MGWQGEKNNKESKGEWSKKKRNGEIVDQELRKERRQRLTNK